jgi:hypothetical protein
MLIIWIVLSMMFPLSAGGGGRALPLLGDCSADEDHCKHGEDVSLDGSSHHIEGHKGDRYEKTGQRQHDRANEDAAHDVAEQADDKREDAGDLLDDVERDHDPCRLGEGGEVAGQASRPDPVKDRRAKDDRAERGIGLQMSGRRLDARDQRRPIGDKYEDEDGPDQGAVGARFDLHCAADLIVDGADEEFQDGLGFRREEGQSARDCDGEQGEECHDRPGDDHRLGDGDRSNVEERCGL